MSIVLAQLALCCTLPLLLSGRKEAKLGHHVLLVGQVAPSRIDQELKLGPSSWWPFYQWKLAMLSLERSKISAVLILTGAASGVTAVSETPCTPLPSFPPPKNNSFIHREAKMENSMAGSSMPNYLQPKFSLNLYLLICLDIVFPTHQAFRGIIYPSWLSS